MILLRNWRFGLLFNGTNSIKVLHLAQWSILLTLSAIVGVANWFCQNNRMIDTSWCVDSKMTEDVVKDLLLFQGRKKR